MNIRGTIWFLLCLIPATALAQEAPRVIPLWQNGAPGFESKRNEPEQAKDYWVRNIHNPSVTVYKATAQRNFQLRRISLRKAAMHLIWAIGQS